MSQQSIGRLTVGDLRRIDNTVRRARQCVDLPVTLQAIPPAPLAFAFNIDPSLANIGRRATQAGYVIGAT